MVRLVVHLVAAEAGVARPREQEAGVAASERLKCLCPRSGALRPL